MNDNPKVSVIIPYYNAGKYISQCLDSVFKQTYQNIEIVLVNDGSKFEVKHIPDKNVKDFIFIEQAHQGVSAARNTGLRNANGEMILFLDADDFIVPEKIALQVGYFIENPKMGLVHSGWWLTDESGNPTQVVCPWNNVPELNLRSWLFWKPVFPGAMLIRREWVEKIDGFDPSLSHAEDVDLVLRMVLAGCRTIWLKAPTVYYRQHSENTVNDRRAQLEYGERVLEKFFLNPMVPAIVRQEKNAVYYYNLRWQIGQLAYQKYYDDIPVHLEKLIKLQKFPAEMAFFDALQSIPLETDLDAVLPYYIKAFGLSPQYLEAGRWSYKVISIAIHGENLQSIDTGQPAMVEWVAQAILVVSIATPAVLTKIVNAFPFCKSELIYFIVCLRGIVQFDRHQMIWGISNLLKVGYFDLNSFRRAVILLWHYYKGHP